MSSRPGTNRLSRCASHRIGKGPVAQPDSRSRGPGHLVGAVFGGDSVAFLSQMTEGPTVDAFRRLVKRPVFSYGTVDNRAPGASPTSRSSPRTHPSCSRANGPAGGAATSTTNSSSPTSTCRRRKCSPDQSNFSPSGEAGNDDQLIMIDDPRVATAYAIEAVRVFDHLQFRDGSRDAFGPRASGWPKPLHPSGSRCKSRSPSAAPMRRGSTASTSPTPKRSATASYSPHKRALQAASVGLATS